MNSGLVYYLYRFYEPTLQRWVNMDPLDWPEPHGWSRNTFRAFVNSPLMYFDPFGKMAVDTKRPPGGLSTIICQGGKAVPRVSDKDKSGNSQCVVDCMTAHEQSHADEANAAGVCKEATDGMGIRLTPQERVASEIKAYKAMKACLEKAKKTATPTDAYGNPPPVDCKCRASNVDAILDSTNKRLNAWETADPENTSTWPQDDM